MATCHLPACQKLDANRVRAQYQEPENRNQTRPSPETSPAQPTQKQQALSPTTSERVGCSSPFKFRFIVRIFVPDEHKIAVSSQDHCGFVSFEILQLVMVSQINSPRVVAGPLRRERAIRVNVARSLPPGVAFHPERNIWALHVNISPLKTGCTLLAPASNNAECENNRE